MPAHISIYDDPTRENEIETIQLAEVVAPEEFEDLLYSAPMAVYGRNTGDTHIRELQVHLQGEGIEQIQLAQDDEGQPGVWADNGQPIWVSKETIYKGDDFLFWARGVYGSQDAESDLEFKIIFKGLSTGVRIASEN